MNLRTWFHQFTRRQIAAILAALFLLAFLAAALTALVSAEAAIREGERQAHLEWEASEREYQCQLAFPVGQTRKACAEGRL